MKHKALTFGEFVQSVFMLPGTSKKRKTALVKAMLNGNLIRFVNMPYQRVTVR